jgi:hypothetical protein
MEASAARIHWRLNGEQGDDAVAATHARAATRFRIVSTSARGVAAKRVRV